MTITKEIDLDKLEKVAKAIEHGLWDYAGAEHGDEGGRYYCIADETGDAVIGESGPTEEAARHIAAACPAVVLELVRRLRAAEADANRYRGLRDHMHFSTSKNEVPEMGLRTLLQAPDHNPHADWVGDRFDASVDRCVDRFIAAQGASHD